MIYTIRPSKRNGETLYDVLNPDRGVLFCFTVQVGPEHKPGVSVEVYNTAGEFAMYTARGKDTIKSFARQLRNSVKETPDSNQFFSALSEAIGE